MGSTIHFTVDLHRVGCGAVLTLYLSGLPAVDSNFRFYEQQPEDKARSIPGCGGQMYYADANPEMTGCSSYGFEFDLFEGNVDSMHSTAHGCVAGLDVPGSTVKSGFAPSGSGVSGGSSGWYGRVDRSSPSIDPNVRLMHNQICDGDGIGVGISGTGVQALGNRSYGWGDTYTINTQHPFEVAIRFDDDVAASSSASASSSSWSSSASSSSWSYTTTLTQAGRSIYRTTRKADAVTERAVFPRVGVYTNVRLVEAQQKQWIVVDGQYLPRVPIPGTLPPVRRLFFAPDGTTVDVPHQLRLGDAIELGGYVFSNNVTSATAMRTSRRQQAWDELGVSLRSKGLAMVLAYWAQGRTSLYKELGEWDTFWLNGECERKAGASGAGGGAAPYPWHEAMGWGCLSHIRIERNPDGSAPPANLPGQEPYDDLAGDADAFMSTVVDLALVSVAALGVFFCWRRRNDADGPLLWTRSFLQRHTSRVLLPMQEVEPVEEHDPGSSQEVEAAEETTEEAK